MLNPKLVELFIENDMSLDKLYSTSWSSRGGFPSTKYGFQRIQMVTINGTVPFTTADLYEFDSKKEYYTSKLYKLLVGYNDEET
jgi:hypothetical protein